jgi:hypothetical protein
MIPPELPNIRHIELCLTYRCNVPCPNCSNQCTQAPAAGDLPLAEIQRFVAESLELDWDWEWIVFHGGEPALHPEFPAICEILQAYREASGSTARLFVTSNGTMPQRVERAIKMGFAPAIAPKRGQPLPYVPVNESPTDLGLEHSEGCFQSWRCGICLNYLGYFECSPAAAAARVFGYGPIVKNLRHVTAERLASGYKMHCRHCGFALPGRRRVTKQTSTPTWERALADYAAAK